MARPKNTFVRKDIDKMYALYLTGKTFAEVGLKYNCSYQNIKALFAIRGLRTRSQSESNKMSMTPERKKLMMKCSLGHTPWNKGKKGEYKLNRITPPEKLITTCVVCGKEFNNNYKYDRVTCCKKCDSINKKGKRSSTKTEFKKGQKAWNKKQKVKKICIRCNKKYIPCYSKQKYCSSRCFVDDRIKGIPLSEEIKQKISMGLKKKTKFDKYCTSLNKRVRHTNRWKLWREKVFIRDDFTCQRCGLRGVYLEPHHIVPVKECINKNTIDKIFDVFNGVALCRLCHMKTHKWKINNKKESD